jgi:tRNA A-37 threonylcarbamoyl transferase component Bud32
MPVEADTDLRRWARAQGAEPQVALEAVEASARNAERYAVEALLGRGGAGEVHAVVDRDLGRRVARKKLKQELRQEPVLLQAFLEEAMITGALEHPGIVPVYDLGISAADGPWYTMKRLEGEALSAILSRLRAGDAEAARRWPLPRLVEVFVQVLRAMAYSHQRGVIHCDLKPSNVLVGSFGEVVVCDWGLAKVLGVRGERQARAKLWSGSYGYMAPEQATSADIARLDEATDIWALGAMLYELIALVVPQAGADGKVPEPRDDGGFDAVVPLRQRGRRELPADLEAVAMAALQVRPEDRPKSVVAMLEEVEAWLAGTRERERREARILAAMAAADAVIAGDVGESGEEAVAEATRLVTAGLREAPNRKELAARGSGLYWKVFEWMHREALPKEAATALLDELAEVVVPHPEAGGDVGPWLEALDKVGEDAPRVKALAARVRALHAAPPFSTLDGHGLVPVANATEARSVEAGEPLFIEGAPAEELWILVEGEVEVRAGDKLLTVLKAPASLGEIGLVEQSTRTATVIATTRVEALTLSADRFDVLVRRHGNIAVSVMKLLARRLREATAREIGR